MDSDQHDSGGTGAEGMADDNGSDIPKLIYYSGRAARHWQDAYYHVCTEILGGATGLLYRTYINDNGKPCGLSIQIIKEACVTKR
jgi:hypothetical protein